MDLSSVLHYLAPLSEKVVKSLTLCVLNPALSENICTKLLYSVTGGAAEESAHARISVLSSLILQSCRKRSDRAETVTLYACMCLKTSFSSPCAALLSLGDSVIAGLKDANVHLLGALITVFGEVVSEVDLTAETAQSLKDLISAPLAFVLLKWGIGDVKGEGSSKRSTQLESMWATARKAEFLVPSLITVLSEFVTKGSLRLKNELQVLESDDNALSSCAVSTVLYEMVKENLLSRNGKAELKSCLDNIGRHSSNMDTTFSKFVYLKESFL
uniref:Uncharacterized protein n=1 Tax=Chloropicon primus TaxID=1764295 RepID=A0A7S2T1R8_9CHLO